VKENVGVKLECDIGQSIINTILNFLKTYFFTTIKQSMIEVMPEMLSGFINDILGDLPDDVEILKGFSAKFAFTGAPFVKAGYLVASILAYVHENGQTNPPPYKPPALPDGDGSCKKGMQLFLSDYVIRTAVETMHRAGKLSFKKTMKVVIYTMDLECHANSTPSIGFNGSIAFLGKMSCTANFKRKALGDFKLVFFVEMSAILKEWIKDSRIYFSFEKIAIDKLTIEIGKEIDEKTLLSFLNFAIEELRKYLNAFIEVNGIPLPTIKMFDFSDVEQKIVGHYIQMCGTLKPKTTGSYAFPHQTYYATLTQ
jgi:hypothetical protein